MLIKWEFWALVFSTGTAALFAALQARWEASPVSAVDYSDETTWVIRIGIVMMVIGVVGLIISYFASRKNKPVQRSPDIRVTSKNQHGGVTAYEVNIDRKRNKRDGE